MILRWIRNAIRWVFRVLSVIAFGVIPVLYPISYRCTVIYEGRQDFDVTLRQGNVTMTAPNFSGNVYRPFGQGWVVLPAGDHIQQCPPAFTGVSWFGPGIMTWPLWLFLLPSLILGAFAWIPGLFRDSFIDLMKGERHHGLCGSCGYELTGLKPGSRCPECGTA